MPIDRHVGITGRGMDVVIERFMPQCLTFFSNCGRHQAAFRNGSAYERAIQELRQRWGESRSGGCRPLSIDTPRLHTTAAETLRRPRSGTPCLRRSPSPRHPCRYAPTGVIRVTLYWPSPLARSASTPEMTTRCRPRIDNLQTFVDRNASKLPQTITSIHWEYRPRNQIFSVHSAEVLAQVCSRPAKFTDLFACSRSTGSSVLFHPRFVTVIGQVSASRTAKIMMGSGGPS